MYVCNCGAYLTAALDEAVFLENKQDRQRLKATKTGIVRLSSNLKEFTEEMVKSEDQWLVMLYTQNCTECEVLAPMWQRLSEELQGLVSVGAVDVGVLAPVEQVSASSENEGIATTTTTPTSTSSSNDNIISGDISSSNISSGSHTGVGSNIEGESTNSDIKKKSKVVVIRSDWRAFGSSHVPAVVLFKGGKKSVEKSVEKSLFTGTTSEGNGRVVAAGAGVESGSLSSLLAVPGRQVDVAIPTEVREKDVGSSDRLSDLGGTLYLGVNIDSKPTPRKTADEEDFFLDINKATHDSAAETTAAAVSVGVSAEEAGSGGEGGGGGGGGVGHPWTVEALKSFALEALAATGAVRGSATQVTAKARRVRTAVLQLLQTAFDLQPHRSEVSVCVLVCEILLILLI